MTTIGKIALGPLGLSFEELDVPLKNVTGSSVPRGTVMELDLSLSDADSTNLKFDKAASGYGQVVLPQSSTKKLSILVVALETVAAATTGKFRVFGKAKVLIKDSAGTGARPAVIGDEGVVATDGTADIDAAVTGRVVARVEEANGDVTTAQLLDCFFDGRPASS